MQLINQYANSVPVQIVGLGYRHSIGKIPQNSIGVENAISSLYYDTINGLITAWIDFRLSTMQLSCDQRKLDYLSMHYVIFRNLNSEQ